MPGSFSMTVTLRSLYLPRTKPLKQLANIMASYKTILYDDVQLAKDPLLYLKVGRSVLYDTSLGQLVAISLWSSNCFDMSTENTFSTEH